MQALPDGRQCVQPMPVQPGQQFPIGFELFLQGLERIQPGIQFGQGLVFLIHMQLRLLAHLVQLRHLDLQGLQAIIQRLPSGLCLVPLLLQGLQPRLIGHDHGTAVGGQPFTSPLQLTRLLLDAALLGGQHLDRLLNLHHGRLLGVCPALGLLQIGFQVRQLSGLLVQLGGQQLGLFGGAVVLFGQCFQVDLRRGQALRP